MEQRDFLKDQIEQLGRVLGKILSDFLALKSKGNVTQGIEVSNESFQDELDIDIEELVKLDNSDFKEFLNTRKFTETHLEILSEYLIEVGKTQVNKSDSEPYVMKAIELLDIADEISKTLSLERMNKKNKIKKTLS